MSVYICKVVETRTIFETCESPASSPHYIDRDKRHVYKMQSGETAVNIIDDWRLPTEAEAALIATLRSEDR